MAITIKQQPQAYTPAFSEQVFVALSNQTASANFIYTVKVTDMITGDVVTYPVAKRPDNYLVFDAQEFAQSYFDPDSDTVPHYIPMNEYGWKQCTGIRKIRVNIGETYGSTPAYIPGSNIDYIVWNGIILYKDFPSYDLDTYVFRRSTTNLAYLTRKMDDVTFPDRSSFLYVITTEAGDITELEIKTYNSAGSIIGSSSIANPSEALTTYSSKYLCIDVGHKGLSEISSGLVTGTFPIITDSVAYYTVSTVAETGGPPSETVDLVKTIRIGCEPRYPVYTVHFLSKSGAFETINFSKRNDIESQVTKTTMRRDPHRFNASAETYTYSPSTPQEYVLSILEKETLKLSTDFLTQDQADLFKQIIKSSYVFLDTGSEDDYLALRVSTSSLKPYIKNNEKLYQLVIDFELAHVNTAQT